MSRTPVQTRQDDGITAATAWTIGIVAVVAIAGMFYILWRGQFAAAPRYVFDMPTPAVEAGFCLSVAQDVVPAGAPIGSYFDEAAQFWIKRMRTIGAPMGPSIASARARIATSLATSGKSSEDWLQNAMEVCSNRALMYGARFRAFD